MCFRYCGDYCTKIYFTKIIQKRTKQCDFSFLWENVSENSGLKQAGLAQNQQKHSANQEVSLTIYSPFTSENSLLDWGMKQTTPSTPPAPDLDLTGRQTRPMGLGWKQESLCQVA